ncbi:glutathione S-transferase [Bacterioplanes sanyensis]|jgi:glutathione S-transferase|uniref:glutathione S-transferase N-terminal domain-containing protein n=1 Tax=Bacterioplanes sanyensis TaxID=1249553 RepID=UPI0019981E90|nr:glutathione S-transferase N-terminal domain-containing protein [Bacterioplanes sanyensis]GGY55800.1 glutathione S-transferase [Bacterioplanes sanyensis]
MSHSEMTLIAGTESTWSLRVWMCFQLLKQPVQLEVINLAAPGHVSRVMRQSQSGLVPVLKTEHGAIHDSLAIIEYLNERFDGALYPESTSERALARSLCAEVHAGFNNLRAHCGFSVKPVAPMTQRPMELSDELQRLERIFARAKGRFMFAKPGAVDTMFAITAYRLESYGIQLNGMAANYQKSLIEWPLLQQTLAEGRRWLTVAE